MGRTGITGAVGKDLRAPGGWEWPGIAQQVRGEVGCGCWLLLLALCHSHSPHRMLLVSQERFFTLGENPRMGMGSQAGLGVSVERQKNTKIATIPAGMGQISQIPVC